MKVFKNNNLKEAVGYLKNGKVIICPTDTVYGLICDATNKRAIQELFKIKKREINNPIPIFVKDFESARKISFISKKQEKIIKKSWPGKTTFVLNRKKSDIYGIDKKTIALRIPDYKIVNSLLLLINKPLSGTSANVSGKPSSTRIEEVLSQFKGQKSKPDLVIDAGNLKSSNPSKIVDLTSNKIKILRK